MQEIRNEVERLICAVGAYVGTERTEIYVNKLSRYNPKVIKGAIDLTIVHWDQPKVLPPIGYILSRIDEYHKNRVHEALVQTAERIQHQEIPDDGMTVEERRQEAIEIIREVRELSKKKSI